MRKRSALLLLFFSAIWFGETKGEISTASLISDDKSSITLTHNNENYGEALFRSRHPESSGKLFGSLNEATLSKDLFDYEKTARILESLSEESKNHSETLLLLGRVYYLAGREKEAIEVFKKFLKLEASPEQKAFAWSNLGLSYEKVKEEHNAVRSFKEALRFSSDDYVSHRMLGFLYKKKGKVREAIDAFESAKRIDSSDLMIQRELAGLYEKERYFEKALYLYRKIIFSDSEDKVSKKKVDEITRELGRDYANREKGGRELEKKQKAIFVAPPDLPVSAKPIRIGLAQGEKSIEFRSSTDFILKTTNGKILGRWYGGIFYFASVKSDKTIYLRHNAEPPLSMATIYDGIVIEPVTNEATTTIYGLEKAKGEYWANKEDRTYRGKIEIRVNKNGLNVVNIVSLEEYLYGVVPSEMPSSWPREALKAQVIAARSEALSKLGRHKNEGFDLCDEVHCQAYRGVSQENQLVNKYVDETHGIVMTYEGKPVDALYSSSCGGHTQDNIFGEREEISYLKGSPDNLESQDRNFPLSAYSLDQWLRFPGRDILCNLPEALPRGQFRWTRIYNSEEINRLANKLGDIGDVKDVTVLKREKSGHISSLKILGTKSSLVLDKELVIRKALGNLRSSLFKLEIKKNKEGVLEEFIFIGGGWGHGVGMCQSGAHGLAKSGKNYSEILSRYFKGVNYKKLY